MATEAAMPGPWRSYTDVERAEAVGFALTIGTKQAAVKLGIPRRTLSSWIQRPTSEVRTALARVAADLDESLEHGAKQGAAVLYAIVQDPKASNRDKIRAAEVLIDKWQLRSGGVTARNANLNLDLTDGGMTDREHEQLRQFFQAIEDSTEDELQEWTANGGLAGLRPAKQLEAGDG
jgi:hypothetical protein